MTKRFTNEAHVLSGSVRRAIDARGDARGGGVAIPGRTREEPYGFVFGDPGSAATRPGARRGGAVSPDPRDWHDGIDPGSMPNFGDQLDGFREALPDASGRRGFLDWHTGGRGRMPRGAPGGRPGGGGMGGFGGFGGRGRGGFSIPIPGGDVSAEGPPYQGRGNALPHRPGSGPRTGPGTGGGRTAWGQAFGGALTPEAGQHTNVSDWHAVPQPPPPGPSVPWLHVIDDPQGEWEQSLVEDADASSTPDYNAKHPPPAGVAEGDTAPPAQSDEDFKRWKEANPPPPHPNDSGYENPEGGGPVGPWSRQFMPAPDGDGPQGPWARRATGARARGGAFMPGPDDSGGGWGPWARRYKPNPEDGDPGTPRSRSAMVARGAQSSRAWQRRR